MRESLLDKFDQWADKPQNKVILVIVLICFVTAFSWVVATPEGAIKRNMLIQGYSVEELMSPIELVGQEKIGTYFKREYYAVRLLKDSREKVVHWQVGYGQKACYAKQIEKTKFEISAVYFYYTNVTSIVPKITEKIQRIF